MELKEYIKQLPMRAVRPRPDGSYTIVPRTTLGNISADRLAVINEVVRKYNLPGVRITAAQQVMIDGVSADDVRDVVEMLGEVGSKYKYRVQGCLGKPDCKFGQQDAMTMAEELMEFLNGFKLPFKLKSAVSGCSMCCAESMIRDVGMTGKKNGWTVSFGGNGGKRSRQADVLAEDVTKEQAFDIIRKALDFYSENAKVKERTARFVERVGIDAVKEAVFGK